MGTNFSYFNFIAPGSYWADRVSRQLDFVKLLIESNHNLPKKPLEECVSFLKKALVKEGAFTKEVALKGEEILSPYYKEAKTFTIHAIGHAHIDMNWMWGMHETVSVVLETFRTMLKLLEEYPQFTFSQSQAATYRIVELYEPEMLEKIGEMVNQGRWECTATAWTEFDKNLSSGESHFRQYRQSFNYLSKIFKGNEDFLKVGFEPDTFGHVKRLPDILSQMGINYYYHCRGEVDHNVYRWVGESGGEVLVYREPTWYLGPVYSPHNDPSTGSIKALEMDMGTEIIKLYNEYGVKDILQVYGVGDHGGGPTRKDIEDLIDAATWPCYPKVEFSTLHRFFKKIESSREKFPIVKGEVNKIFTGCYTSQSSIKLGNFECENLLYQGEVLSSMARFEKGIINQSNFNLLQKGWENLLFNQFHDILPGSCTNDSKVYSLALYQLAKADANTVVASALRELVSEQDMEGESPSGRSLGAGVGFNANRLSATPLGDAEGTKRAVSIFNSTEVEIEEVVEILMWDWDDPHKKVRCYDYEGNSFPIEAEFNVLTYWQHSASKFLVPIKVPPFGYKTIVIEACEGTETFAIRDTIINPRRESAFSYVLENSYLKATFAVESLALTSLIELESGNELLEGPSGFLYLNEDPSQEMTSWVVGREEIANCRYQVRNVKLEKSDLRQKLSYQMYLSASTIEATIILDSDSKSLTFDSKVLWREIGDLKNTPQLSYNLNLKSSDKPFVYAIPYGTIERGPSTQHFPSQGWIAREYESGLLQLSVRGKYGFVGNYDSARVILLRSSSDPDPLPEIGDHTFEFFITLHPGKKSLKQKVLLDEAKKRFQDLLTVVHPIDSKELHSTKSIVEVKGNYCVTAIEIVANGEFIEIRGFETEGESSSVEIEVPPKFEIFGHGPIAKCATPDDKNFKGDSKVTTTVGANEIYRFLVRAKSN